MLLNSGDIFRFEKEKRIMSGRDDKTPLTQSPSLQLPHFVSLPNGIPLLLSVDAINNLRALNGIDKQAS